MRKIFLAMLSFASLLCLTDAAQANWELRKICKQEVVSAIWNSVTQQWESGIQTVCREQRVQVPGSKGSQFYFSNNCSRPVRIALHYKDLNNNWRTDGWWQFSPGEQKFLADSINRLASNNIYFYYYAETVDGDNQLV